MHVSVLAPGLLFLDGSVHGMRILGLLGGRSWLGSWTRNTMAGAALRTDPENRITCEGDWAKDPFLTGLFELRFQDVCT